MFGKKPNPKEQMREMKRELNAQGRGLDREIMHLQSEEKKLIAEVKRTAATGNQAATRQVAKQLVRVRQQIERMHTSKAQIRSVGNNASAMQAHATVAGALKGATKTMAAVNKQMNPAGVMKTVQEFERESQKMDMAGEMVGDSIDSALDDETTETEADDLTMQVLDEIGVDVRAQMSSAPTNRLKGKQKVDEADEYEAEAAELARRLATLKG